MRGLLGYLNAFRGDGIDDRERPNSNIGMAFLATAIVVAVVGFQWMATDGDDNARPDGWTLGGQAAAGAGPTTIPASPAAVAVRIGADAPDGNDTESSSGTSGSTLPDGTPIAPVPGPGTTTGSTGTTPPPGSSSTTIVTTVESTETSSTPSSETTPSSSDTTPTSSETSTAPGAPEGSNQSSGLIGGLVGGLLGSLGALVTP